MRSTENILSFLDANRRAIRFLALFALIFGVLYLVFGIAPGVRLGIIKPYTGLLARAVTAIVNIFGAAASVNDTQVLSARASIDIEMGCDGVEASCLFLAGVLAFPTSWRARLIGFAVGVPLIHLINLARLVGLYYAGVYFPGIVEELHVYVAQTLVILLSTALLIIWLERFAVQHRQS
ncbi:MAG TPA: exosortase H [Blastocatellia bacterium]|nr:exosortase H [Blastocatellia bacterium]